MKLKIKIASRKSKLALCQVDIVNKALGKNVTISVIDILTSGDKILDKSLSEIGGKGLFIKELEQRLSQHAFVFGDEETLVDIAILPFIRQFARVERPWYVQSDYPNVKRWLNRYLQHAMFSKVMAKFPLWHESSAETLFCAQ